MVEIDDDEEENPPQAPAAAVAMTAAPAIAAAAGGIRPPRPSWQYDFGDGIEIQVMPTPAHTHPTRASQPRLLVPLAV